VVKSNSFFNFSHSLHTGFSGRDSSSSEFADILTHNFGIPLIKTSPFSETYLEKHHKGFSDNPLLVD